MTFRQWFARRRRRALVHKIAATWGARDALLELEIHLRRQVHALDKAAGLDCPPVPTKLAARQRLEVDGEPVQVPRTMAEAFGPGARLETGRGEPSFAFLVAALVVACLGVALMVAGTLTAWGAR